jgi:hypothetical protein
MAAARLDGWLDPILLTPELGTLRLLIYPILVAGGLFSWFVLGKLQRQYTLSPSVLMGHRLLILLATAVFIRIL